MDEGDFWVRPEFRICAEFQGFEDRQLRCNWCDGLVAEEYDLLHEEPCIRSRCGPSGQDPWKFYDDDQRPVVLRPGLGIHVPLIARYAA
jgi:hypothetical protein